MQVTPTFPDTCRNIYECLLRYTIESCVGDTITDTISEMYVISNCEYEFDFEMHPDNSAFDTSHTSAEIFRIQYLLNQLEDADSLGLAYVNLCEDTFLYLKYCDDSYRHTYVETVDDSKKALIFTFFKTNNITGSKYAGEDDIPICFGKNLF
jgi:hypothetical protein